MHVADQMSERRDQEKFDEPNAQATMAPLSLIEAKLSEEVPLRPVGSDAQLGPSRRSSCSSRSMSVPVEILPEVALIEVSSRRIRTR